MIRFQTLTTLCAALVLPGVAAHGETFDCVIEPALVVEIASPTGGLIQSMTVARGDLVTKGQILALLDSGIEETTVDLMREQAASTAEIEAQRARLKLAQSQAEQIGRASCRERV